MRSSSILGEVVFHFRSQISSDSKLYTVIRPVRDIFLVRILVVVIVVIVVVIVT